MRIWVAGHREPWGFAGIVSAVLTQCIPTRVKAEERGSGGVVTCGDAIASIGLSGPNADAVHFYSAASQLQLDFSKGTRIGSKTRSWGKFHSTGTHQGKEGFISR
jgi:hypothetical protein